MLQHASHSVTKAVRIVAGSVPTARVPLIVTEAAAERGGTLLVF